ncbi:MAG TPA: GNAT family N-acetyltransferase [Candidatus Dormibacteraeota bacterium]|nr:GNAT family N-acetyltransferase [Candidatus Dormibacteraeota bacterium]
MEEITTTDGLRDLRPEWNAVEAAGDPINPFLSWEWQWSWWEAFGADRELHCLVVRDDQLALGIVPLQCLPDAPGVLGFCGGLELSDHLGFVFRPGRALEVAAGALEYLFRGASAASVLVIDLHYLPDGSPELAALSDAARDAQLPWERTQEEVSPRVVLGGDFEEYLRDRLNKKDRHELRRKLRRLDAEQPGWDLVTQAELGLEGALDAFFPILRASGPHKAEFLTPQVESFVRLAGRRLDERGWLRMQFLRVEGQLTAATLGFTVSGTWHLYNSGYQPKAASLSPGLICVAEGIRVAIEEGCQTADFLRGSEAYKYHLGALDHPLWRLTVGARPPSVGSP